MVALEPGRPGDGVTEPDVALTDYGLAILCGALALLIRRRGDRMSRLRGPFAVFFASIGVTALLGGTVHGFFSGDASPAHALLWRATMLGVGVTALSAWQIGARMQFAPGTAAWLEPAALLGFGIYAATVLFVSASFRVAVMNYLPAALFLIIVYGLRYRRLSDRASLLGLLGLALTLVAAALQQARVGLHPDYFNHNALYHLLQAAGLILLYRSAAPMVGGRGGRRAEQGRV